MLHRRKLTTLIALVLAIGMFTAASAQGSAATTLIHDKFDEKNKTEISAHTPNTAPIGSSWLVELGTWQVHKGKAKELSTAPKVNSSDYRATINATTADSSVLAKVYPNSDQMWGVTTRYTGERDWIMAFHDGVGDLILGKKRPHENEHGVDVGIEGTHAGWFHELKRVPMDWSTGSKARTHTIEIVTTGDTIRVYADGDLVITREDDILMTSPHVGIFSRGTGKNQFDEFKVDLPGGGSGPPAAPVSVPETTPEPEDDDDDDDKKGKGKKGKKK